MKSFIKIVMLGSMFFGLSAGAMTQEDRQMIANALNRYTTILADTYFIVWDFKHEKNDKSGCYDVGRFQIHLKNELPRTSALPEDVRGFVSLAMLRAQGDVYAAARFCQKTLLPEGKRTDAYRAVRRARSEIENAFYLLDQTYEATRPR